MFYEQKIFSSFQKIMKMSKKAIRKNKNSTNWRKENQNNNQYQEKINQNTNWQHIKHQLYEFILAKKIRNKKKNENNCWLSEIQNKMK